MMKHFLVLLLLVTGTLSLYGSNDDLSTSKGTDQEVIAKLSPTVAQTDVWNNAKIEVSFTIPLDASSVQKNNIKLVHLSSKTNDHIDGTIDYDKFDNKVVYTPSALLSEGVYEVEIKSLKADKAYKTTQIKEIKYRFYVPEVINGYQLPPELDSQVNNSTLLGIDSNNNGVRDDVEIFIIKKYIDHHKIVTEIGLQGARAYQMIIENPLNTEENHKALHDAMDCNFYFKDDAEEFGDPILVDHYIDDMYHSLQLNTKSRVKAYMEYDKQLSGGVYTLTKARKMKENCNFDVETLLGDK